MVTDVFWLPNIFHDTWSLATHSDYIFIMAYDEQENIIGECTAQANAPYHRTNLGVTAFLDIGIPGEMWFYVVAGYFDFVNFKQ